MDDLVAHIDRRAVDLQRPLDDVDCAHHAGAEAARRAEHDAKTGFDQGGGGLGAYGRQPWKRRGRESRLRELQAEWTIETIKGDRSPAD